MCVVKVNRVESNCFSNKDPMHNYSPVKIDQKAETDTHSDPQHFSGSDVNSRTTEDLRQWPKATQMHPEHNESWCSSSEQQEPSTSQVCSFRDPSLDDNKLHSSSHPTTSSSVDSEASLCLSDSKTQTSSSSCRDDTPSQTPIADSNMDMGIDNYAYNPTKAEKMETAVDSKHFSSHSNKEALYNLKTEPVEGGRSTSCGTLSPPEHNCCLKKSSTEEHISPPMLQKNTADMPLLIPESEGKVGICLLPPVLTQEMPSLTPAHDGIADVSRSTFYNDQVAPVLQRETPIRSLSSNGAKRDNGGIGCMMPKESLIVEHASNWHLALPYNCEVAAVSGSQGNTAYLTANDAHKRTSGGVSEVLIMPDTGVENDRTKLKNITAGQSGAPLQQLFQSSAPQTEQQHSSVLLPSTDNSENIVQRDNVLSLSSADSLLTTTPFHNLPPPPSRLSTENDHHLALQVNNTTYSHCPSQTKYTEPKPFSSSIWKNLNSHSPAVLIQSLNPELPSDFTHDPLPYTMWTEPQCKEVTEQELCGSESQEGESGPLTWAQLEPTSLVSVSAVDPMALCGDYELQRGEVEGSETLSMHREVGRKTEAKSMLESDSVVSPLAMGGSDMEEGVSDCEEAEQQCNASGESSNDSTNEEEEEEEEEEDNDVHNYQCYESSLEPGEICAVSVHLTRSHTHAVFYTNTYLYANAFQRSIFVLPVLCTASEKGD